MSGALAWWSVSATKGGEVCRDQGTHWVGVLCMHTILFVILQEEGMPLARSRRVRYAGKRPEGAPASTIAARVSARATGGHHFPFPWCAPGRGFELQRARCPCAARTALADRVATPASCGHTPRTTRPPCCFTAATNALGRALVGWIVGVHGVLRVGA